MGNSPRGQLDPCADLLGQRIGGTARAVGDQPLREAVGNDVGDLSAKQLAAAVAELLPGLEVRQDDLATLIHHDHGVRRRLEQAAVAALHLRQVPFGGFAHRDVAPGAPGCASNDQ